MKYLGKRKFVSETFGNSAEIECLEIPAYKGAAPEISYRLCCYAEYDDGTLYFCSIYETEEKAEEKLKTLSCGDWAEI